MKEKVQFYIEIITPYGNYEGEIFEGTKEHYDGMIEMAKLFYTQDVFDTYLRDGSFLVMNHDLIRQSMIIVKIKED
jgi:hypothetical protein